MQLIILIAILIAIFIMVYGLDNVINQLTGRQRINEPQKQNDTLQIENKLNTADEIKKFKDLLDNNAITEEEYEAQKKKLLS